jgi:hypothetical protein
MRVSLILVTTLACGASATAQDAVVLRYGWEPGLVTHRAVESASTSRTVLLDDSQGARTEGYVQRLDVRYEVAAVDSQAATLQTSITRVRASNQRDRAKPVTFDSAAGSPGTTKPEIALAKRLQPMVGASKVRRLDGRGFSLSSGAPHLLGLPDEPVRAGDSWELPEQVVGRLRVRMRLTLEAVRPDEGLAVIRVGGQVAAKAGASTRMVEGEVFGEAEFDLEAGRERSFVYTVRGVFEAHDAGGKPFRTAWEYRHGVTVLQD